MLKKCTFLFCLFLLTLTACFPGYAGEPAGPGTSALPSARSHGRLLTGTENTGSLLVPAFVRFEAGEILRFSSTGEYYRFFEEYLTQYRLEDLKGGYVLKGQALSIPEERKYDREAVRLAILERFPPAEDPDPRQTIDEVCRQIRDTIRYDKAASGLTVKEALDAGKGVCWHYVKIADVVLEQAGIPTEIIHGSARGIPHMWLKCRTGDQEILADPQTGILPAPDYDAWYLPYPYLKVLRQNPLSQTAP